MNRAKSLIAGSQLTGSAVAYYTAPANFKTIIKTLAVLNTDSGDHTFTLYRVPNGGTAGPTNTMVLARVIAAGESFVVPEFINQVLEAGDTIQGLASAGNAVTIQASGFETSQ